MGGQGEARLNAKSVQGDLRGYLFSKTLCPIPLLRGQTGFLKKDTREGP